MGKLYIDMDDVNLIRQAAEVCWNEADAPGTAQSLSELAERIVVALVGEPPAGTCAACGWAHDLHAGWCIHYFDHVIGPDGEGFTPNSDHLSREEWRRIDEQAREIIGKCNIEWGDHEQSA